jgi:triphosphoribosyl-dephospho-CoA synthase
MAAALAQGVVQALLDEVRLSPKPGLVDRRGRGAHADVDLDLMCRSAFVLGPSFEAMAVAAVSAGACTPTLREILGGLGRDAEATMMAATGGVNTHRGAIWALGLLVAAAALVAVGPGAGNLDASAIAATAGAIARCPDRFAPSATGNKGEHACRRYRVGGARGQAFAGFPQVVGAGLPALRSSRIRGDPESTARLNALMAILGTLDDTCVLARAGPLALRRMQRGATGVLAAGGAATLAGRRRLRDLDHWALAMGVSPGGAADLLAATLFLDWLDESAGSGGAARAGPVAGTPFVVAEAGGPHRYRR